MNRLRILVAMGIAVSLLFIACKKSTVEETPSGSILVDIDGNQYDSIRIGSQVWMKQNLRTTRYQDGSAIVTGLSNDQWIAATGGAYAMPLNDASLDGTYGKIYNGFAVLNPKGLCPKGWRVPNDQDWETLIQFLGGLNVAGGKMKTTTEWVSPNVGATNSSGFTAYPAGIRDGLFGDFSDKKDGAIFWSSTVQSSGTLKAYGIQWRYASVYRTAFDKDNGSSCRCILN